MTKTKFGFGRHSFVQICAWLLLALIFFFYRSFAPGMAVFSNDAPLGALRPLVEYLFPNFLGAWQDLNWLGGAAGATSPSITQLYLVIGGAVGCAKFYAPFALFILGLCAWFCFRRMGFGPAACVLGGLAAMLNSGFFSAACWGVAGQCITFGMAYLAVGLLFDRGDDAAVVAREDVRVPSSPLGRFASLALAGMAIGMGLMEGADIGAIFSVYVAAFVMFQALTSGNGLGQRVLRGVGRTAVIAMFAALLAAQFISVMISTQIKGVAGTQQDVETKEQQWGWATQWSLPPAETLSFAVPGLFGYRMDTPDGGQYWGEIGRFPGWRPEFGPNGARYTGGGIYSGILVLLIAAWALAQSFRKTGSVFALRDRRWIWFWGGAALVSLLLAWGKFAPFYRIIYSLPYFSTIRNPAKFTHCFNWAVVILFAYGAHGLLATYVGPALTRTGRWFAGFEKKWTLGLLATVGVAIVGAVAYASSSRALESYLVANAFNLAEARPILEFSNRQVGVFVLFLIISVAAIILLQRRTFVGERARWAGLVLGLVLVADLARANLPWVRYYDYQAKYATNPVIDFLRKEPYQHRVAILPFRVNQEMAVMQQVYNIEWLQHLFPFYGIQAFDVVQEPRTTTENRTYRGVWSNTNVMAQWQPGSPIVRSWQLANVQYLVGIAGMADALNQQFDPVQRRFRLALAFDFPNLAAGDPAVVQTNTTGPYGLIDFTGALPRAKLFAQWQVSTNDDATLSRLASPQFDPQQTVVVSDAIAPPPAGATNAPPAPVEWVGQAYTPKHIALRTQADAKTVLLLTDKYDPDWRVRVDGQPATLLRCNYLMRGVELPAGRHEVVFEYRPKATGLYVSLATLVLGIALIGIVAAGRRRAGG